jgi:hypothetical protein
MDLLATARRAQLHLELAEAACRLGPQRAEVRLEDAFRAAAQTISLEDLRIGGDLDRTLLLGPGGGGRHEHQDQRAPAHVATKP